jgi:hypothetical protein
LPKLQAAGLSQWAYFVSASLKFRKEKEDKIRDRIKFISIPREKDSMEKHVFIFQPSHYITFYIQIMLCYLAIRMRCVVFELIQ